MSMEEKRFEVDELLQICWFIANAEAKNLSASEIQPLHFLLAVMKVIDPVFPSQLDKMNIASEKWAQMCKEAESIRRYIDVVPERVTDKRRRLRKRLMDQQNDSPIKNNGMLHRSESLKKAFHDACLLADGQVLTLKMLVQSLFELELVSLDDIKG